MNPIDDLASFVEDHLSHGDKLDPGIGFTVMGLADIGNAILDAQDRTGNWGRMLANLRTGSEQVRVGVEMLRGKPGFEGLVRYAERQRTFALRMIDDVIRLQAGESTPV